MVTKRCFNCNKKLGLLSFDCKCNEKFCTKCRYPEEHNCTYNHKEYQRNILEKTLPKVVAIKVQDI